MATTRPGDNAPIRQKSAEPTPLFGSDREPRGNGVPSRPWTVWDAIKTFSLRNMVFALVLGILAAAGGAALAMQQSAVYSGEATLIIDQAKVLAESKDEGAILKIAFLKIKYADLAKGPAISGPAAESVGVSQTKLSDNVLVTTSGQNLL